MKSKVTILLLLSAMLCSANGVRGQFLLNKSESRINASYAVQYYFNQSYIKNDRNFPDPISTKNTVGYNFQLAYQFTTRWGFVATYGVQYGTQRHDVYIDYDMSKFDPEANSLKNYNAHFAYNIDFRYLNQRLLVGYAHVLPQKACKGWIGELTAGIGSRSFYRWPGQGNVGEVLYETNTPGTYNYKTFSRYWVLLSNLETVEMYLGVRKEIRAGHLRNVAIGLEYTNALRGPKTANEIIVISYDTELNAISNDAYRNKNLSLGLRISAGIW